MNAPTVLLSPLLHGAALVSAAGLLWLCSHRRSAARAATGGRLIMIITLSLAMIEAGAAAWRLSPATPDTLTKQTEPVLPKQPGAGSGALFAVDHKSATPPGEPVSSGEVASLAPKWPWELTPRASALLTGIWIAGASFILLLNLFALGCRRKLARKGVVIQDADWQAMLCRVSGGMQLKLLRHPGRIVPCAWQGAILLPSDADGWPEEQRIMTLAHECAHLRHRDPFWLAVSQWFLAWQWFNPLAWAIVRRCRLASERAADDAVLAVTGDAPSYADLLVSCARSLAAPQRAVCSMAGPSTVRQRVETILDESVDRRAAGRLCKAAWVTGLAMTAVAVLLFIPAVVTGAESASELPLPAKDGAVPATDPFATIKNALQNTVFAEVKWKEKSLDEAITELRQKVEVNFILRGGGDKPLTLKLSNVRAGDLLRLICEATGMQFEVQPNAVVVMPAGDSPTMTIMTYRVPGNMAASIDGNQTAKQFLEKAGIEFPGGAFASYDSETRRLVVKSTSSEHARILNYLEEGNPDPPFEWSPAILQEREYLQSSRVKRFYGFTSVLPEKEAAQGTQVFRSPALSMEWTRNDPVIRINKIRFFLEHPVVENEGVLWISRADLARVLEPVLRPAHVRDAAPLTTVVIDPGHGGEDCGAEGLFGKEAPYTLDTALQLKDKLETLGWKVIMTRTKEVYVPRSRRIDIANEYPDAVFISIHFDAKPNTQGFETFILKSGAGKREAPDLHSQSMALASAVHVQCVQQLAMQDLGVKGSAFGVLAGLQIPGLLLEGGNLLHAGDARLVADVKHRARMAEAIVRGLEAYREAVGRKPRDTTPKK